MSRITEEELLKRKEALLADMAAVGGALQDVDHWLAFLARDDEPSGAVIETTEAAPPRNAARTTKPRPRR